MKSIITSLFILFVLNLISAQTGEFTIEVSNDTVLEGNYIIVKYNIKNVEGRFKAPDFDGFEIIGGPMSNSMFSMVNGKTSRESSYTYYLKPTAKGRLKIPKASLIIGDDSLFTEDINIITIDNPDGIKIRPELKDDSDNIFIDHNSKDEIILKNQQEENKKKFNIRKL